MVDLLVDSVPVTDLSKLKDKYRTSISVTKFDSESLTLNLQLDKLLKYGENPNQGGAVYFPVRFNGKSIAPVVDIKYVRDDDKGKGGLSLTNMIDISRALDNLKFFFSPSVIIMKHNMASGFATQNYTSQTNADLLRLARDADRRSNFGGTLVINKALDMDTARVMYELKGVSPFFVDVLAAPEFEQGVLGYIQKKSKNIRIAKFEGMEKLPKFEGDDTHGLFSIKEMPGGRFGIQDIYLTKIKSIDDFILRPMVVKKDKEYVIENVPTKQQLNDLLTSWYLNIAGARSNGIVIVKDGVSVSIGAGQVERVGAVEMAIIKGIQKAMDREGIKYNPLMGIQGYEQLKNNPFIGAVCSSDGFFPFPDSLELLVKMGVVAIAQPYGSINDYVCIEAANNYGLPMVATVDRAFCHF